MFILARFLNAIWAKLHIEKIDSKGVGRVLLGEVDLLIFIVTFALKEMICFLELHTPTPRWRT